MQRLLVVHGVMPDQWRIEELAGFRKQTRHAKLTVEWIRSGKPEEFPGKNAPVFASLGLLGRSGMKSNASIKKTDASGEWSFSGDAESTILDEGGMDTRLFLEWKGPDGGNTQHGSFLTGIFINDAATMPVASWFIPSHGHAWQIHATADTLLSDGTSWRDARLRQDGGKISICTPATTSEEWSTIREATSENDRKLLARTLPSDAIRAFAAVPAEPDGAIDPFAEQPESPPAPLRDLPDAVIPDHLKDCLTAPLFDLRALLRGAGGGLEIEDFVAYDPLAEKLFMHCKSHIIVDMIQALFMGCIRLIECAMWLADAAVPESLLVKISLLTRSGVKAPFELLNEKDQPIVSFNAEPVLGSEIPILDLRYGARCHLQQSTKLEWHSESSLAVADGIPVLMDATKLADGRTLKQGLRARVIREPR
jgi:hypothetical protein